MSTSPIFETAVPSAVQIMVRAKFEPCSGRSTDDFDFEYDGFVAHPLNFVVSADRGPSGVDIKIYPNDGGPALHHIWASLADFDASFNPLTRHGNLVARPYSSHANKPHFFFVLNGLINGDEGLGHAVPAGSGLDPVLADGWYWLFDGEQDPAPNAGPYNSRQAARAAIARS